MPETNDKATASFGFREVPEADKEGLVREVFSSVAARYDLMNDLMSAGVHRIWKDAMVEWLNPQPGWKVLDVAGGTGDIAFRIAEMARSRGGEADITVCDINEKMLGEGVRRAKEKGEHAISWVTGNAEMLPIESGTMDSYTIAFGIRNVTHIDRALAEDRIVDCAPLWASLDAAEAALAELASGDLLLLQADEGGAAAMLDLVHLWMGQPMRAMAA